MDFSVQKASLIYIWRVNNLSNLVVLKEWSQGWQQQHHLEIVSDRNANLGGPALIH